MSIKTKPPRHNRRHHRNLELLARGATIYATGIRPPGLTDDQLLALDCYMDDMLTLPKGGIKLKKEIAAEKKKRGF